MADLEFELQAPKRNVEKHKKQQSAAFKESISQIVEELDRQPGKEYSLATLFNTHNISRRRFYDVINVLTAVGCCRRTRLNDIVWIGQWNIEEELGIMKKSSQIENENLTLNELFQVDNCVCLSSLTVAFLMLFATIESEHIDLREAAVFFSRGTERYKTTLCKLYQISLILGALGVLERTPQVCEVSILSPYRELIQLKANENESPLSINYLLNGPTRNVNMIRRKREEEYRRLCQIQDADEEMSE